VHGIKHFQSIHDTYCIKHFFPQIIKWHFSTDRPLRVQRSFIASCNMHLAATHYASFKIHGLILSFLNICLHSLFSLIFIIIYRHYYPHCILNSLYIRPCSFFFHSPLNFIHKFPFRTALFSHY
jgi:hypothetical protein